VWRNAVPVIIAAQRSTPDKPARNRKNMSAFVPLPSFSLIPAVESRS
jgi:hypothetical protein